MNHFFNKAAKAERRKRAINKLDHFGANQFFEAIEMGDHKHMVKMIEQGADLHFRTQKPGRIIRALSSIPYAVGSTPLHAVCLYGRGSILSKLTTDKAAINVKNNDGCTPLDYALRSYENRLAYLERCKASRLTFPSTTRAAEASVRVYESIITHLIQRGGKPAFYDLPEKFSEGHTQAPKPPEPPKLP